MMLRLVSLVAMLALALPLSAQDWVISGTVVDASGDGIADVDIDILSSGGVALSLSGDLTDSDGSFSVTILDDPLFAGDYDIEFNPDAGSAFLAKVIENEFLIGDKDLGEITLDRLSVLSGSVVDSSGTALTEVDLQFFDETETLIDFNNDTTDADGNFEVEVIGAVYDVVIRDVSGADRVPLEFRNLNLNVDIDLGELTLVDGYSVTGDVEDEDGSPLVNVDIDVIDATTGEKIFTSSDNTNVSGVFDVLVPEGDVIIEFEPALGELLIAEMRDFTVSSTATNDVGTVVLSPGVELTASVVDENGDAVFNVDIDVVVSSTQEAFLTVHDNSDINGDITAVVDIETYDVQLRPPFITGLAPVVLTDNVVPSGGLDLGEIELLAGNALTGNVTDGTDAVEKVVVTLSDPTTGDSVYVFGNKTDLLGDYALRQVSGTYDVTFTPPIGSGLPTLTVEDVDLTSDATLDAELVASTVEPVTGLTCTVTDSNVELSWTNGAADYDGVEIFRDGTLLVDLAGTATSHDDLAVAGGDHTYTVRPNRDSVSSADATCMINIVIPTEPVSGLSCSVDGSTVSLSWTNGATDYDGIDVLRGAAVIAELAGDATSLEDVGVADDDHTYTVRPHRDTVDADAVTCDVTVDANIESVEGLTCEVADNDVALSWTNGASDYAGIDILRDEVVIAQLAGTVTSYDDLDLDAATYDYDVRPNRSGNDAPVVSCSVTVSSAVESVSNLACVVTDADVALSWSNGAGDYDGIEILRDDVVVADLAGDAESHDDLTLEPGDYTYEVRPNRGGESAAAVSCAVTVEGDLLEFLRGDIDANGVVFPILDALFLLAYGFQDGDEPACLDAADADGNGTVFPILDALFVLEYGFANGPEPPDPGPFECGPDPDGEDDGVTCETAPDVCA